MSENKNVESQEVVNKVDTAQQDYVNEQNSRLSNEAIEVIKLIGEVIEAVDAKDKTKAIEACEKSLGKIEVLLAKDPSLVSVPVDIKEQIVDFPWSVEAINEAKVALKALVESDSIQEARAIMIKLASELDIYITLLPVGTYPAAIKVIIPLIEEERFEEAKVLLLDILDTLLVEKVVIPLPVLRAQKSIERASELTKDKDDAKRDDLKGLIEYAKEQLEIAQALGYGKVEEDYKELFEEIEKIESILNDEEKETKNIFEELKDKLNSYMSSFNKIVKSKDNKDSN